jgi:hypothetical protein
MRWFPEQLPAPVLRPLADADASFAGLSRGERSLVDGLVAGHPLFWFGPTRTRVDVGWWFRKARVWLGVSDTELLLLADGKNPFVEKAPLADLGEAQYNVITGELVLEPAPSLSLKKVVLSAIEAGQVLSQIGK